MGRARGVFLSSTCEQDRQGGTGSPGESTAGLACVLCHVPLTFIYNGVSSPKENSAHREATKRPANITFSRQQENKEPTYWLWLPLRLRWMVPAVTQSSGWPKPCDTMTQPRQTGGMWGLFTHALGSWWCSGQM